MFEIGDAQRILPIFVNDDFVLRPMAGQRIMDVFLDSHSRLAVRQVPNVSEEVYGQLQKLSMDFAYENFLALKDKQIKRSEEDYRKYKYALSLRTEAAQHIGIDNIRVARLKKLQQEEQDIERKHKEGQRLYPEFNLMLLVRLEA